jgi:uncharacterized membrane protein
MDTDQSLTGHDGAPETDRLLLLTDGVFAIAVTLLALDLRLPEGVSDTRQAMLDLEPKVAAYVFSFLVIYSFWVTHQRLFRIVARADPMLIWLNGLFLLCVAFLPFPVATFGAHTGDRPAVVLYACSMTVTSAMIGAIWWYAVHHPALLRVAPSATLRHAFALRSLAIPAIFAVSAGLAAMSVHAAAWSWLLALILPPVLARLLPLRDRGTPAEIVAAERGSDGAPTAGVHRDEAILKQE